MADNVNVTEGAGKVIAGDDVGGAIYQRIKVAHGADGSATDTSTANPLPVVQTGTPGLPTGAATAANQSTEIGHLATVAGAVSAGKVQAEITNTPAVTVSGVATAANQSTGNGYLQTLAGAVAGTEMQADIVAALPAGTNTIGATLDAGPAQTVTRTYTASADMTTAAAITPSPTSGQKIVALDILVSTDTAMNFIVQEETSATAFAKVFLPANGSAQITLRGFLKAAVADKKLMGKASVAGNVAVTAVTFSEA